MDVGKEKVLSYEGEHIPEDDDPTTPAMASCETLVWRSLKQEDDAADCAGAAA